VPLIVKHFVGELSGMDLFNSTCAPHALMIFLMVSPPFPITNPHLFPGTGYSTEFIPGMFAGGPLGGGPPRCLDCSTIS